jgi:hypothetical protein
LGKESNLQGAVSRSSKFDLWSTHKLCLSRNSPPPRQGGVSANFTTQHFILSFKWYVLSNKYGFEDETYNLKLTTYYFSAVGEGVEPS